MRIHIRDARGQKNYQLPSSVLAIYMVVVLASICRLGTLVTEVCMYAMDVDQRVVDGTYSGF